MKTKTLFILLFFFTIVASRASLYQDRETPANAEIKLEFRNSFPGEVIKVNIHENQPIEMIQIRFLNKTYNLKTKTLLAHWIALLGIDLSVKPGIYFLDVTILLHDGSTEKYREAVTVMTKEFPVKKLWVEERFVNPPAMALERIRIESELLGTLYGIFSSEWKGEGRFIVPCEGEISPNFGERRYFNNKPRSQHSGVDISAPTGTPVKASNSGKVVLATDLYYSGNTVIIDHGLGVMSMYCHFSKIQVIRDQIVNKGDTIGEVGATGRVTGPHLHWALKIKGSRVDPFSIVSLTFQ